MKAAQASAVALAMTGLLVACGSHHGVPDAFQSGLPQAQVLMDRVNCDPTPDTCTRYVVLAPQGTSTASLLAAVTQRAARSLKWAPTRAAGVVEEDEGRGYDGPGKTGGFINTANAELRFWARVGYAAESPPNRTVQAAEALMRAHPDSVIVRIDA